MIGPTGAAARGGLHAVLALEAATPAASVAVLVDGVVVAEYEAAMRAGADDPLLPAVDAALRAARVRPSDLAAVVCGAGPGGFTSLRIAAALAKGLVHASGCAFGAVPSLALAAAARAAGAARGAQGWLVTLDALRGERYAAEVDTWRDEGGVRVTGYRYLGVRAADLAAAGSARTPVDANATPPRAAALAAFALAFDRVAARGALPGGSAALTVGAIDPDAWEPDYGRQAEAQARWESTHGRPLATALAADAARGG